jgi:very-short-patch-repair endonuclease
MDDARVFDTDGVVGDLAARQAGIVSRRQLYESGVTRAQVRAHVRARRWRRVGSQSVAVATGPLTRDARLWAAVFEAGPRAQLDGASSLEAAGLRRFDTDSIRASVPRGARVRRARGLDIRQTRRWHVDDCSSSGIPRTPPAVAAVRTALWAKSDRQAALVLTMSVQQGLTSPEQLGIAALRVRRDKRRQLLHAAVLDLVGGVRSLGELDFARECRRRGLPEPSRQSVRRGRNGRCYLDVAWEEWGVAVEIDGIQHSWALHVVGDALRQNAVTLQDMVVLRLPLLGFRVARDEFFAQIEQALVSRGCRILGRPA